MKKITDFMNKHKRVFLAAMFLLVFFAVLAAVYTRGVKNPIKEKTNIEPPSVLENAFLRWFRGDDGELFATFRLVNHTDVTIVNIKIACASFLADNTRVNRYETTINISLFPSEVRILNRAYIGALDPLAQKVNCVIESWE